MRIYCQCMADNLFEKQIAIDCIYTFFMLPTHTHMARLILVSYVCVCVCMLPSFSLSLCLLSLLPLDYYYFCMVVCLPFVLYKILIFNGISSRSMCCCCILCISIFPWNENGEAGIIFYASLIGCVCACLCVQKVNMINIGLKRL